MPTASQKPPYDLIIVGAGPIGIATALAAQRAGLEYLVVEKGALTNSIYNYPVNMRFFSTSELLALDDIPFVSREAKPSKQEALDYYRSLATSRDLNIQLYTKVTSIEGERNTGFSIKTNRGDLQARNVVLATGFFDQPNRLNVPGEDLPHVSHYYGDPHEHALLHTVVVGASNSAVDAALEIYRKGGKVTLLVRGPEIGSRVKYWVRPDILNRIKEGSITAQFNTRVVEIMDNQLRLQTDDQTWTLDHVDRVLLLTGYLPDFSLLKDAGITLYVQQADHEGFLHGGQAQQGLTLSRKRNKNIPISAKAEMQYTQDQRHPNPIVPTYDAETLESNVPGLYLAGVVCGGEETHVWFIENSRAHGEMIVRDIVKTRDTEAPTSSAQNQN